jgi:hypothetical protein
MQSGILLNGVINYIKSEREKNSSYVFFADAKDVTRVLNPFAASTDSQAFLDRARTYVERQIQSIVNHRSLMVSSSDQKPILSLKCKKDLIKMFDDLVSFTCSELFNAEVLLEPGSAVEVEMVLKDQITFLIHSETPNETPNDRQLTGLVESALVNLFGLLVSEVLVKNNVCDGLFLQIIQLMNEYAKNDVFISAKIEHWKALSIDDNAKSALRTLKAARAGELNTLKQLELQRKMNLYASYLREQEAKLTRQLQQRTSFQEALDAVYDRRDAADEKRRFISYFLGWPDPLSADASFVRELVNYALIWPLTVLCTPFTLLIKAFKLPELGFKVIETGMRNSKSSFLQGVGDYVLGPLSSLIRYTVSLNPYQAVKECSASDARPARALSSLFGNTGKTVGRVIGGLLGGALSFAGMIAAAVFAPSTIIGTMGTLAGHITGQATRSIQVLKGVGADAALSSMRDVVALPPPSTNMKLHKLLLDKCVSVIPGERKECVSTSAHGAKSGSEKNEDEVYNPHAVESGLTSSTETEKPAPQAKSDREEDGGVVFNPFR